MTESHPHTQPASDHRSVEDDAIRICQDLIRIDTSNYGDDSGPRERKAAEYVMNELTEIGLDPVIIESEAGRASVVARLEGEDSSRGGLVVHGHLDVVPANASDWQVNPFSGEIKDGCIWGRGAIDMKDMDAMILANVRAMVRAGRRPKRDLVIAMFADEEAGGVKGSHWLVENRPELFDGATEAVSEVGGYSVTFDDVNGIQKRAYLLQTAEKGIAWLRLVAHGRAGHGSVPADDNAIVRLAEAIARIDSHKWPREYIASVTELLDGLSELTGVGYSQEDASELLDRVGPARAFIGATLQNTANFTMLHAGYKNNVIPQTASANLDCRFLPGHEEELMQTLEQLAGEHVEIQVDHRDIAVDSPFDVPLVDRMKAALHAEDPGAAVLPYCLSAGTDNKALTQLGINGYGFVPLRLPADLDFAPMFHGINERVPLESLAFGTRVLGRFLAEA